jgi:uncharacterized protein (DUF58 family)
MKKSLMLIAAAGFALTLAALAQPAAAQDLVTNWQLARSVDLRNVAAGPDGDISGTIVNRTNHEVRNVRLMIDYAWMWQNDFKPGEENPGRTVYVTAPAVIPPHGEGSFTYRPSPPLESSAAGHFIPTVHIVGFTQMVLPGS